MRYCTNCGKQNDDVGKFCVACGAALEPVAAPQNTATADTANPAPAEETPAPAEETPAPTGKRAKFLAARNKVSAFEQKHCIIVNALLAACALVIMLVTLFAPVKVMAYVDGPILDEGESPSYHYAEIDQPIWNFVEALGYISIEYEDSADVAKVMEIEREYQVAVLTDNLSDVNYIAYVLAKHGGGDGFSSLFETLGGAAFATVVFGIVVFILAMIMAIISLVYLIYAIVGMAKKKTSKSLFKYLFNMMSFSVSSLSLLAFAPMTKTGGSMFAVLLLVSILMLLLGAGSSLVMGRSGVAVTVKRAAVSLVMLIATCILFTNAVSLSSGANVPYGYGIFGLFVAVASQNSLALGNMVGPAMLAVFGCAIVAYAGNALCFSLRALTGFNTEHYEKKSFNNAILLVVFAVIAIVFAFVGAPYITAAINGTPKGDSVALLRAQVYVSASLFLILAILIKAFKPKDIPLFGAPPPVSLMETANGAPAPEAAAASAQPDLHVTSVEDVAEPVVDEKAEQAKAEQNEINDL